MIAFCGGLIAIGVHGLVDFHYNYPVIWIYAGLGMAILRLAKQELALHKEQRVEKEQR